MCSRRLLHVLLNFWPLHRTENTVTAQMLLSVREERSTYQFAGYLIQKWWHVGSAPDLQKEARAKAQVMPIA